MLSKGYLKLLISLLTFSVSFSQINYEEATWFEKNAPYSMSYSSVNERSIIAGDNNQLYYAFFDNYDYAFKIEAYDQENDSWENILFDSQFFNNVIGVKSYRVGSDIYFALGADDEGIGTYYFYKLNTENNNIEFITNQTVSLFNSTGLSNFNFVVNPADDRIYVTTSENNSLYFYTVRLSDLVVIENIALNMNNNNNTRTLGMAQNHSNGDVYISWIDMAGSNHKVYIAPYNGGVLQAPVPLSDGDVIHNSSIATGFTNELVERETGAPNLLFHFDDFDLFSAIICKRLDNSIPDVVITDTDGIDPSLANRFRATGNGEKSYVITPRSGGGLISFEIDDESFTRVGVGANITNNVTNPEVYGVAINPVSTRIYTAYNTFNGDPSNEIGYISFSNFSPIIEDYTLNNICAFSFNDILENIVFYDPDGDDVQLLDGTSNDGNLEWFFAYQSQNGTWNLEARSTSENPTAEFVILFSDGFVNSSSQYVIDTYPEPTISFISEQLEICINELPLDLNGYVTVPNGEFSLYESQIENGVITEEDLWLTELPLFEYIDYYASDENGCFGYTSTELIVYDKPSVELTIINSSCENPSGSVEANVTSPNGPYISYWNNGTQNADLIENLIPGNYFINVLDDIGCLAIGQANVGSAEIEVTATITDLSCHNSTDGAIDIEISGGQEPYFVLWSNGKTANSISNLGANIYELTVKDASGCEVNYSYEITNPGKLRVFYDWLRPSTCSSNDGEIMFDNAENAQGDLSFEWSNGAAGSSITELPGNNYSVIATDEQGCSHSQTINLFSWDNPSVNTETQPSDCYSSTGSIRAFVWPNWGNEIVSVEWDNGMTGTTITNLAPGDYTVTVTQDDGCVTTKTTSVGVNRPERPSICLVTVDSLTTTNLVVWEKEDTDFIDYYKIYRETSQAGRYELIDTVHYSNISVFNDVVASPRTKSWRYQISAVNHCGIESGRSSRHKTIHLVTTANGSGDYRVTWDNYEGINFTEYSLWRFTNEFGWELVQADIPTSALPLFIDNPPATDGLDYMIEIDLGSTCTATFGKAQDYNTTRSNKGRGTFNPGEGTGDPNNSVVTQENANFAINLYPNPNDGRFKIDLAVSDGSGSFKAEIMDITGKVVDTPLLSQGVNEISLNGVNPGIYLIRVSDGEFMQMLRVSVR